MKDAAEKLLKKPEVDPEEPNFFVKNFLKTTLHDGAKTCEKVGTIKKRLEFRPLKSFKKGTSQVALPRLLAQQSIVDKGHRHRQPFQGWHRARRQGEYRAPSVLRGRGGSRSRDRASQPNHPGMLISSFLGYFPVPLGNVVLDLRELNPQPQPLPLVQWSRLTSRQNTVLFGELETSNPEILSTVSKQYRLDLL